MSSILKALKRLEDDFPKDKGSPAWSQNIDTRGTIKRKSQKAFLSYKWLGLLGVAVMLCAGGWFVFHHYGTRPPLKDSEPVGPDQAKYDTGIEKREKPVAGEKRKSVRARTVPGKRTNRSGSVTPLPVENSPLKLQAISWSRNPRKCIAVINDVIVREGGTVDGFSILRIGKDDVIVTREGKEHRLVFNSK